MSKQVKNQYEIVKIACSCSSNWATPKKAMFKKYNCKILLII